MVKCIISPIDNLRRLASTAVRKYCMSLKLPLFLMGDRYAVVLRMYYS